MKSDSDLILPCQWPKDRTKCLRHHCKWPAEERAKCTGYIIKAGDRIGLQNLEFDALEELVVQWRRLQWTAVVDDDYPEVRHGYEVALEHLLWAVKTNRGER
jgi:hypothetical protein